MTDGQVAAVVARTLESAPKNATHRSTRSMAKEMGLSQSSVSRIWRAFGLQPHPSETFKLSTDPYLVDKVHDVVGLYLWTFHISTMESVRSVASTNRPLGRRTLRTSAKQASRSVT